jgi:hypothetical protein
MINNAIFCRHFTTTRPLPSTTDIVSSQTCPFDSVISPRSMLLAPIDKPNIPSSIDTWDEQKTEKSRKIKRRRRRRRRKTKSMIIQLMYRTIMY